MNKLSHVTALLPLLAIVGYSGAAKADTPVTIGLAAGYGIPSGSLLQNVSLKDVQSGEYGLRLDAAYRVIPNFGIGVIGGLGIGAHGVSVQCPTGVTCSILNLRFGVEANFYPFPASSLSPWIGVLAGYEHWSITATKDSSSSSSSSSGSSSNKPEVSDSAGALEYGVHAGLDVALAKTWSAGPYISYTLASYGDFKESYKNVTPAVPDQTIKNTDGGHSWLFFGIRGMWSN